MTETDGPKVVFAMHKPYDGKDADLLALIRTEMVALLKLGFVTLRPAMLLRSANGTYIHIFEWVNDDAVRRAHVHPEIAQTWEVMDQVSDSETLGTLTEVNAQFPHFEAVALETA